METQNTPSTPRVYVACLASYNAGKLHGEWTDATDADEIRECITRVLATSTVPGAEEYAIHDYDGFGEITSMLGEHPDLDTLAEHGRMIEEHGQAWIAYVGNVHIDFASAEDFTDTFHGEYDSAADYVEEAYEGHEIPDWLRGYVDWESMAHDWTQGGDITAISTGHGTVYLFGGN